MLFEYFTVYFAGCASGVGFVGIYVHCGFEVFADSDDNVAESERTRGIGKHNAYYLTVLYAQLFRVGRGEMNVTFCCYAAFGKLDFAAGANEFYGGGAGDITGFANGRLNSERAGVGERYLYLICFAYRAEYGNAGNGVLRSYNVDFFFGCELTGLRKIFLDRELMAGAEKDLERFLRYVYVTR